MTRGGAPAAAGAVYRPYMPTASVEWLYFAQIFYSIMGPALGVSINMLGMLMLLAVAGACVLRLGTRSVVVLQPVLLPVACGVSYVCIQLFVYKLSLRDEYVREFIPWMASLVAAQCLALRRGFLHRAALVVMLIGASALPFLRSFAFDSGRVGLQGVGIGNPNDLGAWFGFCCLYFGVVGLESRRHWLRVSALVVAAACLFVVGLTVSRAPLFALALSAVVAARRLLRRGFVAVLAVLVVVWVAYGTGVFDAAIARYLHRGLEDTGRFVIWPLAIARFLQSPWFGVGANAVSTLRPMDEVPITPHNGFIFIALAAGAVPLALFALYWLRLFLAARRLNVEAHEDAGFQLPLTLYSFLIALNLNEAFMSPWLVVTLASVSSAAFLSRAHAAMALVYARPRPLRSRSVAVGTHPG